jgi:conjugal transfer pilin signal peptidase TrbI
MPAEAAHRRSLRHWMQLVVIGAACIGAGEGVRALSHRYQIGIDTQTEPCMPGRINLIAINGASIPERGELVAFRTDRAAPYLTTAEMMGKQVVGLPGDRYRVKDRTYYVNEEPRGRLNLCDKRYVARYCDDRSGVVPAGEMLVWTAHPNSFDSRYWGPLPQATIVGRIIWPTEGRFS